MVHTEGLNCYATKVLERVFEKRIWQHVKIYDMQFGYMRLYAIFVIRQLHEKYRA